jgi:hypothetical protein
MRRWVPFLLMVALISIPILTLLLIQGGIWFSTEGRRDWLEPTGLKVVALQEDRTVLMESADGTALRVWLFGLDIYAPDSPVREVLFDITAAELLMPDLALSCRVRDGLVYPVRMVALCMTTTGDLGEELIASGAAEVCQNQMKFLPKGLNYSAVQAETHRARLQQENRQSEECRVRGWATRDNS